MNPRSLEGAAICRTPTNSLAAAEWCGVSIGETVLHNIVAIFNNSFIEVLVVAGSGRDLPEMESGAPLNAISDVRDHDRGRFVRRLG